MRPLSSPDVTRWLNPWPIRLPPGRWRLRVVPLLACGRYAALWLLDEEKRTRRSAAWWAAKAARGQMDMALGDGAGHQHYVHMLARYHVPVMSSLTLIVKRAKGRTVVLDGNNHLIAALMVRRHRYARKRCPFRWVGVLEWRGK